MLTFLWKTLKLEMGRTLNQVKRFFELNFFQKLLALDFNYRTRTHIFLKLFGLLNV